MTPPAVFTATALKRTFEQMINNVVVQGQSFWNPMTALGAKAIPKSGLGGEFIIYPVQTTLGSTTGGPNSSGSISNFGIDPVLVSQLSMRTSQIFGRAQIDQRYIEQFETGRYDATFIEQTAMKVVAIGRSLIHQLDVTFTNLGTGIVGLLADSGSTINAAATGDLEVENIQFYKPDMLLEVERSGSFISGVALYVTKVTNGVGTGTITVRNVGASAYTSPVATDSLYITGTKSQDAYFISGLDEGIGVGAYPRASSCSTQVDHPLFVSSVQEPSSGVDETLTINMLESLIDDVLNQSGFNAQQMTEYDAGKGDQREAKLSQTHRWLVRMAYSHLLSLRQANDTRLERFVSPLTPVFDPMWGKVETVRNFPLIATSYNVADKVYFVDTTSWGMYKGPSRIFTQGVNGPWKQMDGSVNMEMAAVSSACSVCLNRQSNGRLNNVVGIDSASVGLVPSS